MSLRQHRDVTHKSVPFMDLTGLNESIQDEILVKISHLVKRSSFVLGPMVESFEESFADYCEADHAVGCNSGTSAIHMALSALGVGPGDEVITVSHTFIGSVWGILYCGARPVFADIDPYTMLMDIGQIESLISDRTRAIVPVHLYGQPVDMAPLMAIARKHHLPVVEDAAQAHGARYHGRRVGSLGDMACFSFYPGKNLGAWGEGGAVVTSDASMAERLRRLRDHGQPKKYHHIEYGYNYRMDAVQAAVLGVKLKYLDEWNRMRSRHAAYYSENLGGINSLVLPAYQEDSESAHHLYVVRHPERDELARQLLSRGVATGLHYPIPVHKQRVITELCNYSEKLSVTESASETCLSLPLFPDMSAEQRAYVVEAIRSIEENIEPRTACLA